ncbi:putative major capsid protein [Clostridium phage vB_CtyS-FA88]|nr:putative major capsid protein [Clostridium phage vB_CtyS-FA88]
MTLEEFINSQQIALYITNLPPESTLDKTLFPPVKQFGTEIELAKGSKQKPVALRMSTFDVAVKPRALNASLNILKKELPFFKESVMIKEKDRQMLIMAMGANNQNLIQNLLSQVYDNYQNLVDGAEVQMRRARAQLLQHASINITTVDGDIVVDYDAPANHRVELTGTDAWSNPDADVVGDLIAWQKILTNDGYGKANTLVLTETTLNYILKNTAILNELKAQRLGVVIVTEQDVINYLSTKLGLGVAIVNGTYRAENGAVFNYYEDNFVTMIPSGTLGRTIYGTTPEEADLILGSKKHDTAIVNTGVAITTMPKVDPVTIETKVSQLALPSFDRVDECFFAKVAE